MRLTVLQVGYPFAAAGPDAVGGAEQVLSRLDHALAARGHRSLVVAPEGSITAGTLFPTPLGGGELDPARREAVEVAHRRNLLAVLAREVVDLVHMHGIDFHRYLPPPGVPVLVTLHLPPAWYPPEVFRLVRPDTWLHAVSRSQQAACPPCPTLLGPIPNGVPVAALRSRVSRRRFALNLGRICPEKNQHEALEAGSLAGLPVLLGGQVFPYPEHEAYWRDALAPRLARGPHRFLGPLGFARKRLWLGAARCLLSTSRAPETSSLVAMEALACGTPVIAYPSGALPEIVEHGVTGFLVETPREMAAAIGALDRLDPEACREAARRRFDAGAMMARYLDLYARLTRQGGDLAALG